MVFGFSYYSPVSRNQMDPVVAIYCVPGSHVDFDNQFNASVFMSFLFPFRTLAPVWLFAGLLLHAMPLFAQIPVNIEIKADDDPYEVNDAQNWSSGTFDNAGVLEITETGKLIIGNALANTNQDGVFDLGVVKHSGILEALQSISFAEGSYLYSGSVVDADGFDVIFEGPSYVDASVTADRVVFNASSVKSDETTASTVIMNDSSVWNVGEIVINSAVQLRAAEPKTEDDDDDDPIMGDPITITGDLILGDKGSLLVYNSDLIIEGNYVSEAGSALGVYVDEDIEDAVSNLVLKGGDTPGESGYNNVIGQTLFVADNTTIHGKTLIEGKTIQFYGNLILAEDSETEATRGLVVRGKLTLEEDARLDLECRGDSTGEGNGSVFYFGASERAYNAIFLDGFELKTGATLSGVETTDEKTGNTVLDNLQLALGGDSVIEVGATLTGGSILLTGISADGKKYEHYDIANSGTISTEGNLDLVEISIHTYSGGIVEANYIVLRNNAVLSFDDGASLQFIGDDAALILLETAEVDAAGSTLNFGSASVISYGTITANEIIFGDGGRYEVAGGIAQANATFLSGSTLALNYGSLMDFGGHDVSVESGATIELRIGSNNVGWIKTTGDIAIEDGVQLSVVNASSFGGRLQRFYLAQGSADSEYTTDGLEYVNSKFFALIDYGTQYYTDEDGMDHSLFWADIMKIADLVDYAGSSNQQSVASIFDALIADDAGSEDHNRVYDALVRYTDDAAYCDALDKISASSRENAILMVDNAPRLNALYNAAFNPLSLEFKPFVRTGAASNGTIAGQNKSMQPGRSMSSLGGLSPNLWFNSYYNYNKLDGDGNTRGGKGNRGGVLFGAGLPTASKEALLGLSFGYSGGEYKQDGDKTDIDDWQIGLYGGANLFQRNLQIRAFLGYGMQDYDTKRTILLNGMSEPAISTGNTDGTSLAGSIAVIRPVDLSSRWLLKPSLGLDFEKIDQDGYKESGGAAWSFEDVSYSRTMMRFGLTSDYNFGRSELNARVIYGVKLAGDNYAVSRHAIAGNEAYGANISSVHVGTGIVDIGFGGNFGLNERRSAILFLDYNGGFSKRSNSHTASFGFLWKH